MQLKKGIVNYFLHLFISLIFATTLNKIEKASFNKKATCYLVVRHTHLYQLSSLSFD